MRRLRQLRTTTGMDVLERGDLLFPRSLPEFHAVPGDYAACATYPEKVRWRDGFGCRRHRRKAGVFFRFSATGLGFCAAAPPDHHVGLTAGTVIWNVLDTPLSVWFWAAYLVASQTPCMLLRNSSARSGCRVTKPLFRSCTSSVPVWFDQDQDRIGGRLGEHFRVDEGYIGGRTRGKGRGRH